jgi:uncharacterized protein involved in exopolysaccharide biosynthesis
MTYQNDPNSQVPNPAATVPPEFEDEINLLDLLQVLLKRKKMIFWTTFCAGLLSIIISLLLPKIYTATARILPPQESESGLSGLLSQVGGGLGGLAGSLIGMQSSSDLYVGILESRTVADGLIEKFTLKELYDCEYMTDVYEELSDRTNIGVSRTDQIISIDVEDRDPEQAADMANEYVQMLDQINRAVNISSANRKRMFLENRLKKVKADLAAAEQTLKEFQEKYNLVSIEDQARVAIEGAATIKGEIIATQTELEVLKEFGTERQNEVIMLNAKITELQKQLGKIEKGGNHMSRHPIGKNKNTGSDFYLPFDKLPELGMQLFRLLREAKIQEKVFELMTTQYELAKIEEARNVNTIQVLDEAVPPDKKSSPKRALIVVLSTLVVCFMAVLAAFIMEYIERLKTEDPERYRQLKKGLKIRQSG